MTNNDLLKRTKEAKDRAEKDTPDGPTSNWRMRIFPNLCAEKTGKNKEDK